MKSFHDIRVSELQPEARDAIRITLEVPEELREEYAFRAGQHLPIEIERDGRKLRRTYSICSPQDAWPLQIGVRIQPGGQFSEFASQQLAPGNVLDIMPPSGRFYATPDPDNSNNYLGFAAGSGITPILSIMATLLRDEPGSRFTLFYGNRTQRTTMFIDDLYALKNRYMGRLQLHFLFSREEQEFAVAAGRLDAGKVAELVGRFCPGDSADAAFICGPDTMIESVTGALLELGLDAADIHAERFGVPRKTATKPLPLAAEPGNVAKITVVMDGHRKNFEMPRDGGNIVDAAAAQGIELPYSCKGGVCATCRTFVRTGEVDMATNYGLEPWEVEKGFVLACQSTPRSDTVLLDYDET